MKKRKTFTTLILATALLAPTIALVACEEDAPPSIQLPLPPTDEPSEPNEPTPPENPELPETPTAPPVEETPTPPAVQKAAYIRCTGDSVNLRRGAGTSFAAVGSAKKGEIYAVVGKEGSWYKTYYRGQEVYISTTYATLLSMEKGEEKIEKVLNEGYRLLGVPYVYGAIRLHDGKGNLLGGFTTQKFDCSSLVQYVFYKGAQKNLQVTTRTQVKQGQYVAREDLQRGDCIYFTNESRQHLTGVERVGHVAIYLGDNYILHTASDYARIEKITAARWSFYIETRRFV